MGADGKMRWVHSLDTPAAAPPAVPASTATTATATTAAATAATASAAAAAVTHPSGSYQPPAFSPAANSDPTSRTDNAGRGRVGNVAAAAAASAAAVVRYWTSSRLPGQRLAETASDEQQHLPGVQSAAGEAIEGAGWRPRTVVAGSEEAEAEALLLSAAERGEGLSALDERDANRQGSESGDWSEPSVNSAGQESVGVGGGGGRGKEKVFPVVLAAENTATATLPRCDSFGDEVMMTKCPGYYTT